MINLRSLDSCYFISLCLAKRCSANSPSYLPPPQLRRKKKNRSGHNPIIGVPKKSIPKRSQQKNKQTTSKKKSDTFSVFFPHRPRFPPVTFKKPTFPKKKHHPNPPKQLIQKKRKRPTDENYDETTVPPTPWISHPWRPVERLYQYWRCFDHRLQDLLAYLGIQTDESFKNSLETPQKSRGLTEPPQKKKALGVKWNTKLFFFLLTKNWGWQINVTFEMCF